MGRKKNKPEQLQYPTIETRTYLGTGSSFKGKIFFTESVTIRGSYEGEINTEAFLYIAEGATVRASISAATVIVGGVVHGNIVASESIEMLATCKVYGNVSTALLHVADGVVFEGQCKMIAKSEELDIFAEQADQHRERYKQSL